MNQDYLRFKHFAASMLYCSLKKGRVMEMGHSWILDICVSRVWALMITAKSCTVQEGLQWDRISKLTVPVISLSEMLSVRLLSAISMTEKIRFTKFDAYICLWKSNSKSMNEAKLPYCYPGQKLMLYIQHIWNLVFLDLFFFLKF
jgi:hypothetical protein